MRIILNGEEYRLFFHRKWEQPGGVSRPNGTVELRHATWMEVPERAVRDQKEYKMSDITPTIWRGDLWRTTEAILAKVIQPNPSLKPAYAEVAKGFTRCSPLDKFDKEHGRTEALRRLQAELRKKGFTGEQLGEIFKAYQETRPLKEGKKKRNAAVDAALGQVAREGL